MRMLKVVFRSSFLLAIFLFLDIGCASCCSPCLSDSSSLLPENYRNYCSGSTFGQYDNVASRFYFHSDSLIAGFDFGIYSRKSSFSLFNYAVDLNDSVKAVSKLYFVLGSKREQILFLDHVQRLSNDVRLFVGYHNLVSEGFFKNSFARNKNLLIAVDKSTRLFKASIALMSHKSEFSEFGGIRDSSPIEGLSKSDLAQLDVFLSKDKWTSKETVFSYSQYVLLFANKVDSTGLNLNFNSSFNYFVNKYSYVGEGASDYYSQVYLDSAETSDTAGFKGYQYDSDLTISLHGFSFLAGGRFLNVSTRIYDENAAFSDLIPFVGATFRGNSVLGRMEYSRVVSDSYRNNSSSFILNGKVNFNSPFINAVSFNLSSVSSSAPYLFYFYKSNHFSWMNNFKDLCVTNKADAHIALFGDVAELSGSYSTIKNFYFLNRVSLPELSANSVVVSFLALSVNKHFGKVYLSVINQFNLSNNIIVPVPDWQSEIRASWRHNFFRNALKAEFGVSGTYTSSWFSQAYNPALGNYYFQNDIKSEGYPVINVFANLGIASATLFLKIERVNYGLSENAYYLHPGYPAPPRTLKFGVLWNLKN